jgi:hypothetical protein
MAGNGILNLGDQRVPKLTKLQTKEITTASDSTTELEPCNLPNSQGALTRTAMPLFNPGTIANPNRRMPQASL